jgi:hypothetical protein
VAEPLKVGDPITVIAPFKGIARTLTGVVTGLDERNFHYSATGVIVGTLQLADEGRTWVRGHGVETARALKAAWMLQGRP